MMSLRQADPLGFAVRLGKASCFCVNHNNEQHEVLLNPQASSTSGNVYASKVPLPVTDMCRNRDLPESSELQDQSRTQDPFKETQVYNNGAERGRGAASGGLQPLPPSHGSQEQASMTRDTSFRSGASSGSAGDGRSSPAGLTTPGKSPKGKRQRSVPMPGDMGLAPDRNPVFYLNMLIAVTEESGKTGLAQISELTVNADESPVDDPGHGLLETVSTFGVGQLLHRETISASIAKEMAKYMPIQLMDLGLRCAAEESFRNGGFVVLRISVVDYNLHDLVPEHEHEHGHHHAVGRGLRCLQSIATCCGNKELFNFHHENHEKGPCYEVVKQMCQKLPAKLKKNFGSCGIMADIIAKSEAEQANHFYRTIRFLNAKVTVPSFPLAGREIHNKLSMYVNILVLAKNESLENIMRERVRMANPGQGTLHALVARGLGRHVTSDHFAAQLAVKMPTKLPEELQKMGVTAEAEEAYRHKSFVVVKLTILNCDRPTKKGRKERIEKMNSCLECLEGFAKLCGYREKIEEKVEHKSKERILENLCELLPEEMPERLSEDGFHIQIEAKPELEQAAFFFRARRQLENPFHGLAPPRAYLATM